MYYTIILGDQTEITNLELNGNNFISDQIITDETSGSTQIQVPALVPQVYRALVGG